MHNFPNNIDVVCKIKHTKEQALEIFKLAIENNLLISVITQKTPLRKDYPYFCWDGKDEEMLVLSDGIADTSDETNLFVSLTEFKAFILGKGKYTLPFNKALELNSGYKAVVTKQSIKVGCQEFTHDKIKELYQLSQKALKAEI